MKSIKVEGVVVNVNPAYRYALVGIRQHPALASHRKVMVWAWNDNYDLIRERAKRWGWRPNVTLVLIDTKTGKVVAA